MPGTTPDHGLTYPVGGDPVMDGDEHIRDLALALDEHMTYVGEVSGLTGEDQAVAFLVNDDTTPSATRTALDGLYGTVEVNAAAYGITTTATGTANSDGMDAIYADVGPDAVVQVAFPERGVYNFARPFQHRGGCTFKGVGPGLPFMHSLEQSRTELRFAASCLTHDGTTQKTLERLTFTDLQLSNRNGAAPIFNMNGLGLIHSTFERCDLLTTLDTHPVFKFTNVTNCFGNVWRDTVIRRAGNVTVPAFDFYTNRAGAGTNGLLMESCTFHSYNNNVTPFMRLEYDGRGTGNTAQQASNLVFRNIISEQSLAGVFHLYGVRFCQIDGVIEWDGDNYVDDVFKFGTSTAGNPSHTNIVRYSGTSSGAATFNTGKGVVDFGSGISNVAEFVRKGKDPGEVRGTHFRLTPVNTYELLTASTTLTQQQRMVRFSGTGPFTCTLPSPASTLIPTGHSIKVINSATNNLTVATATGTIYDKTSLVRFQGAEYVSDGANWHSM